VEQFLGYLDGIFEPLLNALSDPSDAVVLLVLEVHSRIAEEYHHFHHLVSYLIRTFHNNHVLLEKYAPFLALELILNFLHEFLWVRIDTLTFD
jgi:vacuole morphology and inheritance protein 14